MTVEQGHRPLGLVGLGTVVEAHRPLARQLPELSVRWGHLGDCRRCVAGCVGLSKVVPPNTTLRPHTCFAHYVAHPHGQPAAARGASNHGGRPHFFGDVFRAGGVNGGYAL